MSIVSDDIKDFITTALAQKLKSIKPVYGGGNNQIYRIILQDNNQYALKNYHVHDIKRDQMRLHREYNSFIFLHEYGEQQTPKAIACDKGKLLAIYSWITGAPIVKISNKNIMAVVDFVSRLKHYSKLKAAKKILPASDNALYPKRLFTQIERRLKFLEKEAYQNRSLQVFLHEQYKPAYRQIRKKFYEKDCLLWMPLSLNQAILSPSDFGFHNMLKKTDGSIFFVDFEYFGWEDPAALLAHFLLHPGMKLSQPNKTLFYDAISTLFSEDVTFQKRFHVLHFLLGFVWILILLNEFLPFIKTRRLSAGQFNLSEVEKIQMMQLQKAQQRLDQLKQMEKETYLC